MNRTAKMAAAYSAEMDIAAQRIHKASKTNEDFESAAGHLRAAMECVALLEGFEPNRLSAAQKARFLAMRGSHFGSNGEIGGVTVFREYPDEENQTVWLCNPLTSAWVTVENLLEDIEGTRYIEDWCEYPETRSLEVARREESKDYRASGQTCARPSQQGGFGTLTASDFF
jgi:hypothetical protein